MLQQQCEKDKNTAWSQKEKVVTPTEINVTLIAIAADLREMKSLLKCLNSFAKVSDLKFSNEEKSQAFVKFILH